MMILSSNREQKIKRIGDIIIEQNYNIQFAGKITKQTLVK